VKAEFFKRSDIDLSASFQYNNAPFSAEFAFKQTRYSDKLFFTDEQTELNILLSALSSAGDIPSAVRKGESPDFLVNFGKDNEVGIEVTSGIDSEEAKADNMITDISYGLSKWAYADPTIEIRITNMNIAFFMPYPPKRNDEKQVIAELQRFLREENFTTHVGAGVARINPSYKLLTALGVKTYCAQSPITSVQITRGAMTIEAPHLSERLIHDALNRKKEKAATWGIPRLWLVIALTGHYYAADYMLRDFDPSTLNISPFERLYVNSGKTILRVVA
jgi:hypothetical protein